MKRFIAPFGFIAALAVLGLTQGSVNAKVSSGNAVVTDTVPTEPQDTTKKPTELVSFVRDTVPDTIPSDTTKAPAGLVSFVRDTVPTEPQDTAKKPTEFAVAFVKDTVPTEPEDTTKKPTEIAFVR